MNQPPRQTPAGRVDRPARDRHDRAKGSRVVDVSVVVTVVATLAIVLMILLA